MTPQFILAAAITYILFHVGVQPLIILLMDDSEDHDNNISLPEPSLEQSEIIKAIRKYNVLVDSVAGAGKTTTVCLIGKNQPSKKILLLTYNKRLKHETHVRVKKNSITNST